MNKPISQIFTEAREIHKERGYHKGSFVDAQGQKVCMLGALKLATGARLDVHFTNAYLTDEDKELFFESACVLGATIGNTVSSFNDDTKTTAEDIDLAWKRAIYAAEEREETAL